MLRICRRTASTISTGVKTVIVPVVVVVVVVVVAVLVPDASQLCPTSDTISYIRTWRTILSPLPSTTSSTGASCTRLPPITMSFHSSEHRLRRGDGWFVRIVGPFGTRLHRFRDMGVEIRRR